MLNEYTGRLEDSSFEYKLKEMEHYFNDSYIIELTPNGEKRAKDLREVKFGDRLGLTSGTLERKVVELMNKLSIVWTSF